MNYRNLRNGLQRKIIVKKVYKDKLFLQEQPGNQEGQVLLHGVRISLQAFPLAYTAERKVSVVQAGEIGSHLEKKAFPSITSGEATRVVHGKDFLWQLHRNHHSPCQHRERLKALPIETAFH